MVHHLIGSIHTMYKYRAKWVLWGFHGVTVVWTGAVKNTIFIERIWFDSDFVTDVLPKLVEFYVRHIFPKLCWEYLLVFRQIQRKQSFSKIYFYYHKVIKTEKCMNIFKLSDFLWKLIWRYIENSIISWIVILLLFRSYWQPINVIPTQPNRWCNGWRAPLEYSR